MTILTEKGSFSWHTDFISWKIRSHCRYKSNFFIHRKKKGVIIYVKLLKAGSFILSCNSIKKKILFFLFYLKLCFCDFNKERLNLLYQSIYICSWNIYKYPIKKIFFLLVPLNEIIVKKKRKTMNKPFLFLFFKYSFDWTSLFCNYFLISKKKKTIALKTTIKWFTTLDLN